MRRSRDNAAKQGAEPVCAQPKLKLTVQYAAGTATLAGEIPTRAQFRKWVKAALTQDAEIALRIVNEVEGRRLNRDFRNKDYATNVLTFTYGDTQPLSGDIVLCAAVVKKEAQQQHKSLPAHYAHLTVHGVLHLQGWDHVNDADAAAMEQSEVEIVTRLGYADPYKEYADG